MICMLVLRVSLRSLLGEGLKHRVFRASRHKKFVMNTTAFASRRFSHFWHHSIVIDTYPWHFFSSHPVSFLSLRIEYVVFAK